MSTEFLARMWGLVLLTGTALAGVGVGAMFLLALEPVTGPNWHRHVRAVLLRSMLTLPTASILILGAMVSRPWMIAPKVSTVSLLLTVLCLGTWLVYGFLFRRAGSGRLGPALASTYLIAGAITVWLAAHHWYASLTPGWGSSILPVYLFAGFVSSSLAVVLLQTESANEAPASARADVQRLAFAFACLWVYTWYAQYMLAWYVNQPHEAGWYTERLLNGWRFPFYGVILLKWVVPFVLLFPWVHPRSARCARMAALAILSGQVLDLFLIIGPVAVPQLGVPDLLLTALVACVLAAILGRSGRNDDRFETIAGENAP